MRFRLGLFFGFAIGYVLGAKAGRERYAQIQSLARQVSRSEPAQQLSGEVRSTASRVGEQLESKASEKAKDLESKASKKAKDLESKATGKAKDLESKASEKVTQLTQAVRNGGADDGPQSRS